MASKPRGNGTGGGRVDIEPMAHDWIVARTVPREPDLSRIPNLLVKALVYWLGERQTYRVGSALGIVTEGYTAEIHLWYDKTDVARPGPQALWVFGGIAVQELVCGWAVVKPAALEAGRTFSPDELIGALRAWLREHPTLAVTATLGIEESGETTALLVWFELIADPLA